VTTARRLHYTYAEYLRALEDSSIKLEFCDGVIYAMAGGTVAHGQLGVNATSALRARVKGKCAVLSSDVKIRVEATDLTTFPDGSVVCGKTKTSDLDRHAVINPTLLIEVTSASTEDYDRSEKLSHYKRIPSLQAVLFVSHRRREVTVVARARRGWSEKIFRSGEDVELPEPAVSMGVDELYEGVELDD
jgi:Uma2 family endonuclease